MFNVRGKKVKSARQHKTEAMQVPAGNVDLPYLRCAKRVTK